MWRLFNINEISSLAYQYQWRGAMACNEIIQYQQCNQISAEKQTTISIGISMLSGWQ